MTTTLQAQSLNLSERYLPNWSAWEIGREIISNAQDASPLSTFHYPDPDTLVVTTPTAPTLAMLTVIGAGTKSSSTETIGQFGEGFKMAALACTREGGRLTCQTPEGTLTFSLRSHPGLSERVLHCHLDPTTPSQSGCRTIISLVGIQSATLGRFLAPEYLKTPAMFPRSASDPGLRIYVRGVFICDLKEKSLQHYNLIDVPLNRDRATPDIWHVRCRISSLLQAQADLSLVKKIYQDSTCFEITCLESSYSVTERFANLLRDGFRFMYGEKAVLDNRDQVINQLARDRGYTVIQIPEGISKHLPSHLIPNAADVIPKNAHLSPLPPSPSHSRYLADLRLILDALDIPADIQIMNADGLDGEAHLDGSHLTVYLHQKLFAPGMTERRLSTLFHELAHCKGDGDGTLQFERSLHTLGGKLARLLLPHLRPSHHTMEQSR